MTTSTTSTTSTNSTTTIPGPDGFDDFLEWMYSDATVEAPPYLAVYMAERAETIKAETVAEIKTLVAETNCPQSSDWLLEKYEGREDELLKNLRRMKSQNTPKSVIASSPSPPASSLDSSFKKKKDYNDLIREKKSMTKKKNYNDLIREKKVAKQQQSSTQ